MYLFRTSETDDETITKVNGKYFTKRYGLPTTEITEKQAAQIAWFELNRRGRFEHLVDRSKPGIPTMSNEEAQNFIVANALQYGIN